MSNESTAQIVERIIESLSEAVSQLVVLVIALQEQNAEMPAQLPQAANAVAGAAGTLIQVATNLANEEYEDYPDIQQQMLSAVEGVKLSAANMIKAVNAMTTTKDRKLGWENLVEACKVIAGKTILLLQIVYGAELRRLFAAADLADDALNKLDSNTADSAPDDFAAKASDAASAANQFAEYLDSKAGDETRPDKQKKMKKIADDLREDAQNLINAANEVLANPDDKKAQKVFDDLVEKTKNDLNKGKDPIREDKEKSDKNIEALQSQAKGDPNFNNLFPKPKSATKDAEDSLDDDEILAAANRLSNLGDKLEATAKRGDPADTETVLKDIDNAHDRLKNKLKDRDSDPASKKKTAQALNDLEKNLPELKAESRNVAKNPKDKGANDKFGDANQKHKKALGDLSDAVRHGAGLDKAADEIEKDLDEIEAAAARGDKEGVEDAAKKLDKHKGDLVNRAKEKANKEDDPNRKKELLDAINALENLLPQEVSKAKGLANNPNDKKAKKDLEDNSDKIRDKLHNIKGDDPARKRDGRGRDDDLENAANAVQEAGDRLRDAAKKGDKPGVNKASNDLQNAVPVLSDQARKKADKETNPADKKKLHDAIDDLEQLLPAAIRAANNGADRPNDPQAKKGVDDATDDFLDSLANVKSVTNPEAPTQAAAEKTKRKQKDLDDAVKKGDPKAIEDAARDLQNAHNDLQNKGRKLGKDKDDPSRRKEVDTSLDDGLQSVPKQVKNASRVATNPKDPKAKKEYDDETPRAHNAVDNVKSAAHPKPKDHGQKSAGDLDDDLERLIDAVNEGDPNKTVNAAQDVTEDGAKLANAARKEAARTNDPVKKRKLLDAADKVEQLVPDVVRSAKDGLKNNKDPKKKQKLQEDADKLRNAADDVLRALAGSPEEALAAKANKAARDGDKLAKGAKDGNPHAMRGPTNSLARGLPKIRDLANEVGNKSKPEKKKDLNNAMADVDESFPEQIKAARNVAQDPKNHNKQKEMDDKNDDLGDALRKLAKTAVSDNPEKGIHDAHEKIAPASQGVSAAAKKGDMKALHDPLSQLEDATRKLIAEGKAAAANEPDPRKRKQFEDAVADLEDLLRNIRPDAEAATRNPNDKKLQDKLDDDLKKLKNAADKLADATQSAPLAELEEQEKNLDALANAAKKKDPKGISDSTKALANHAPKLADAAKKEGDRDPSKRRAIQDALDELDRLLSQQIAPAALKLAKNPNDKKAQDDLDDAIDNYRGGLKDLGGAMKPNADSQIANDADRAKEALKKVKEAAKAGKPKDTDDRLRDLDDPIDDLLNKGRGAARKENDPNKRRQLEDKLDEIEKLIPRVQKDARNLAKNPNDPKAQDELDDSARALENALDKLADQIDPSHKKKGGKQANADADKVKNLLPKLEDAIEGLRKNPNDPKARKNLEDLLDQLEDPASSLADFLSKGEEPTDGEKASKLAKDYGDSVDDIEKAARKGDAPALAEAARKAANLQKELTPKVKEVANKEKDPARRKQLLDALEDLENLLPQNIRAAQAVLKNPKDSNAKKQLADTNEGLKDASKKIAQLSDPTPERAILAAGALGKDHGAKLQEALKKGDKPKAEEHLSGMEDALHDLLDGAREDHSRIKDPKKRSDLGDAIKALEDLLNKLDADAKKAISNPKDANASKALDDDINNFGKLADKVADITNAKVLAEAQDEGDAVDAISSAAKRGDPKGVADSTKRLAENTPKLAQDAKNEAAKISDPTRRKNILDSVAELERLLPLTVPAVKSALTSPDDKNKQKELQDILDKYAGPIAKISDNIKPTDDNEANSLAKEAEAALADVAEKAKKGDSPGVENALKNVHTPVEKLKQQAKDALGKTSDPKRRRNLQDALDALDKLLNDLDKAARDAVKNPKDAEKQNTLDDVIHEIKKPINAIADAVKDEVGENAKTQKRAANSLAALRGAKKRKVDPKSLLEAADELAASLKGMLVDVKSQAYAGGATTEEAGKALQLNDLLSELEKAASSGNKQPARKVENLDSLLSGLNDLAASAAPPKGATLEQSISWIAQTLDKRSRALADDPTSKHTASIAGELSKLAECVRNGKRSEFLIAARTISALINNYNNEILQLAKNCQDPALKDRLIQNGQALKNFSVQLKILASVKAASSSDDPASESQLAILASNMGMMLNATINNVQIYRIKSKAK